MPAPGRNRLLNAGRVLRCLFRDTFATTRAAGSVGGTPVDGIGGVRSVTDPDAEMSISGGNWIHTPSVAGNSKVYFGPAFERKIGRCFYIRFKPLSTTGAYPFGFWSNIATTGSSANMRGGFYLSTTFMYSTGDGYDPNAPIQFSTADIIQAWITLRSTGSFVFVKKNQEPTMLTWVGNTLNDATVYPQIRQWSKQSAIDELAVFDLRDYDPRFATDYGLATSRLVSPTAGVSGTATPDATFEINLTTGGTIAATALQFRWRNASNYWRLRIYSDGSIYLHEVVAGTFTTRISQVGGVVTNNSYRFMVRAAGNTYSLYKNSALIGSYSDPNSYFTTETAYVLSEASNVTDVTVWPYYVTLPGGL